MAESSQKWLKTLWEKEKLLDTSNLSFSHSVFKRLVLQTRKNKGLFGKGSRSFAMVKMKYVPRSHFNPLPHVPIFWSSISAANKDMMSKKWTNWNTVI